MDLQYKIIIRERSGGYQATIQYKDKIGKWKQKNKQGFRTKKLAQLGADKLLNDLKNTVELNIHDGYENLTIGDLKAEYLRHIKKHREHNTFSNYEQSLNIFKLDNVIVSKLKVSQVQKFVDDMVGNKSWNTIDRRVSIFKTMLKFANNQYNLPIPNLDSVVMPSDKSKTEKIALTEQQCLDLISSYNKNDSDYYKVILLALTTGLRVGEIVGLTWNCINFEDQLIKVEKQWKKNKETGLWGFGDLKSIHSYRTVPIPPNTLSELSRWKDNECIDIYSRILLKCDSTYSMSANLDRQLKRKGYCTIHELRHTYISKLVANNVDLKTVAAIAGHNIEQTMRTYSHVNDDMIKRASNIIKDIF